MDELQRVAERMMRAELTKLPDGIHTFTDYIDGVGDAPVPIPICVRVEIAGDEVLIDLEGNRVVLPDGREVPFQIERFARYCLLNGVDELGYLRSQEAVIARYEQGHA